MTLIRELIEIPEQVHKSDFVISLKTAIEEPDATMRDYVVTPQLAQSFDRALSLITSAVAERRSKSTYLHASFGAGKSAFMAVTDLLLAGSSAARSKPELGPIVAKYDERLRGRKFLLVPYQAVGFESLEQIVLGGYVEHVRALHPDAVLPAVYVADAILADARTKREELGDDAFFRILSEGDAADEWGDYGAGWDSQRLETALDEPTGSSERDQLVSALLRTHYRAVPGQAQATAQGFVQFDDGLEAISRHARGLGYDAVVMFLDELVLWLASRMSDIAFVAREGAKVVKLVEGDAAERPAPIVSFIARQRELRELVGEHVIGDQAANATDILRHSEGRFDTITLEDRNLPAIAEQRLLRPRDEQARQTLDDAFEQVRRQVDERGERDVLLTETGDLDAFRSLYPFSPALVEALVALSGAMQRERTALKVMLQLLVDGRDRLEVGQLVPLGDLFDAINAGDEPLTEIMRAQFAQARRLWSNRFEPLLARNHDVRPDAIGALPPTHPFVTDARLVKTLLIAALVPEVGSLRGLTVSRLTGLNSGIVRAFIPGTERQQVLDKLRAWTSEIGELRLGDDEHDPTVSVTLEGIDTGPILEAARSVDNAGERRRRLKELLAELLQVRDLDSFHATIDVLWRGFPRTVDVTFANVRDTIELPDEMLRAGGRPRLIIDYPWDTDEYRPTDDRARVDDYRRDRDPEWTAVWLPNFLSAESQRLVGRLVRLDYVLTGDTFDRLAGHLSQSDRPLARSQLTNERNAVRGRVDAILRQAYGVDQTTDGTVETQLTPSEQFLALDPGLTLRPPVGTTMRTFAEGLADQLLTYRFPAHPEFTEKISPADLRHTLDQVTQALTQPGGRLENVEPTMRRVLTRVAGPLQLGTMHSAHFIAEVQPWLDLIDRKRAETATAAMTVGAVRTWLDGADTPAQRRGLTPEVANVVILAVCAATDRTLVDAGRVVTSPDVAKLRDDWEIRAQELPDETTWRTALVRAKDMGVVPASELRSATAVADLREKIQTQIVGDRTAAVRELPRTLELLREIIDLPADAPRARTADAAVTLVDRLNRHPDRAIEVLAELDIRTTAAALGTSVKQASRVAEGIRSLNVKLIQSAMALGGASAESARRLRERLTSASHDDELTTALVERLGEAQEAATDLLARAATPEPPPRPAAPPDPTADPATRRRQVRATAESELAALAERLRDVALELTWSIEEGTDGGR
ncbi:MAG: phage resistance protein [Desertimonas sp.]